MSAENEPNVFRFSEFYNESIYYKTPEKLGKSWNIKIFTPSGDPVLIETPMLKVSRVLYDENKDGHIEFDFPAESQKFYNFMAGVDDHHMQNCCDNSETWFDGRKFSLDFVENAYKSIVMPPKRAGNPCRLRVKLPVKYNKLQCGIYNQHLKPMSIQDSVNTKVICILRMVHLEASRTSLQCMWELEQMKVFEKRKKLTECYIKDIPEDEKWLSDEDEDMFSEMEY